MCTWGTVNVMGEGGVGGGRGQNSVDHSHYFIANEERGDHLPVACVARVDGVIGSR